MKQLFKSRRGKIAFGIVVVLILVVAVFIYGADRGFTLGIDSTKSSTQDLNLGDAAQTQAVFAKLARTESEFNSLGYETMYIKSDDGLNLTGYFIPAKTKSNKLAILAHGFSMTAKNTGDLAAYFHSQGFNVFAADARAHGESEGRYRGMGWLDRKDYLKWIDVLINKLGNDTQIVLEGTSMGGATVMMISGEELPGNVKAIIEDCGYTSVKDIFSHQIQQQMPFFPSFPTVDISSIECRIRAGYSYEEASAFEQVKKSKTPIFFIHGDKDTFVPPEMVYELYNAAQCDKEVWVVPGAEHGKSYDVAKEEYQQRIREFYSKYIH